MTNISNDGLCNETSGFLFSHRCDRLAVKHCIRCGKPVCQDHAHPITEGTACTTCLKNEASSSTSTSDDFSSSTPSNSPTTSTGNANRSRPYYDDPYFYGPRYYPGYGYGYGSGYGYYGRTRGQRSTENSSTTSDPHDPNDFTEGDAESLRNEGDESFESEMGES